MLLRRGLATMVATAVVLAGLSISSAASAETVTIGTSAPKHSPWGKVFRVWSLAVKKKSKGSLKLKFYWNNQQGSEPAMIGKMRAGQLEGAAVTAVGLGKIYKPILALQIPGLFYDWKTLDKARKVMMPDFKKGVKKAGFYLAGFGDVGLYYLMSVNKPIKKPSDMKTLKPYRLTGDGIIPVVAQTIGFTARPLSIPEILPALTSGRIDVCLAPPLAAEQLQWAPQLNYLLDHAIGTGIGALVFSQKTLNRLSPEHRKILKKTGRKAAKMLTKRIRKEDKKALKRIRKKMTVTKLNRAQFKVWDKIFAKARKRLAQGTFDPKLVKKLEKLAGK